MSVITLYHGSTKIVEYPEYGRGNRRNDYGPGFYCTKEIELAKEWACSTKTGGYANIYSMLLSELRVLHLDAPQYGILNWLALLVNNRIFSLDTPIMAESKEYLTTYFLPDISDVDVIEGDRADDSYFTFATDFLSNAISLSQLTRAMRLGKLGMQVVLKSQRAFAALRFIRSEPADGEIYFSKRTDRDKEARNEYLNQERGSAHRREDIFMLDVLREEMKHGDARLQGNIS